MIHVQFDKVIKDPTTGTDCKIIDCFVKDDKYRTIFETNTGGGSTNTDLRRSWETRMWGDCYDGFDALRPKYGCMNLADDPQGDYQATQYGTSYFVLKNSVRWRCSITSTDSSCPSVVLGSVGQCSSMLMTLNEKELSAAVTHDGNPGAGRDLRFYKEIQIHGEVRFAKDIERVVADASMDDDSRTKVENFARMKGLKLEWRKMEKCFTHVPDAYLDLAPE